MDRGETPKYRNEKDQQPPRANPAEESLNTPYETAFEDRELCLAAEEGYDAMIRAGHGSDPVIASGADEERCLQNYYQYLRMLQLRYPVNSVRPVPELAVA